MIATLSQEFPSYLSTDCFTCCLWAICSWLREVPAVTPSLLENSELTGLGPGKVAIPTWRTEVTNWSRLDKFPP